MAGRMPELDYIRKVLDLPTFQDQDETEMLSGEVGSISTALKMLLDQVEALQDEVRQLKLNQPEDCGSNQPED
jgi:hypothetical protein